MSTDVDTTLEPRNLRSFLSFRLTNLSRKFAVGSRRLIYDRFDLSLRELRILLVLHEYRALTSTALSEIAHLDKGTISRGVKDLIRRNLLVGHVAEGDLRCSNLKLTAEGANLAEECFRRSKRRIEVVLEVLNESQREDLHTLLQLVEGRLDEINGNPTILDQVAHLPEPVAKPRSTEGVK